MEQMILYVIMACIALAMMLSGCGEETEAAKVKKETVVVRASVSGGMPELTETDTQDVAEIVSFEYDFGEGFAA